MALLPLTIWLIVQYVSGIRDWVRNKIAWCAVGRYRDTDPQLVRRSRRSRAQGIVQRQNRTHGLHPRVRHRRSENAAGHRALPRRRPRCLQRLHRPGRSVGSHPPLYGGRPGAGARATIRGQQQRLHRQHRDLQPRVRALLFPPGTARFLGGIIGALLWLVTPLDVLLALCNWIGAKTAKPVDWGELDQTIFKISPNDEWARAQAQHQQSLYASPEWMTEQRRRRWSAAIWLVLIVIWYLDVAKWIDLSPFVDWCYW